MSENRYDSVRYPGQPYRDSHIEHLHTLGRWWGMDCADPGGCRVLEIGCGDGANLLPMAQQHPGSEFVGIDLAAEPLAAARRLARELALGNVELRCADLRELAPQAQSFDYVIAHGVFSWVEAPVREALLALIALALRPQGIAFVSYNCYPGCHRRAEVWEMLRFHIEGLDDPAQRLAEARALAALLHDARSDSDLPARALQMELERVLRTSDGVIFHDDLAPINQPFYFHEFIAQAGAQRLQFLGEASLASMGLTGLSAQARGLLEAMEPLAREQYLDFMRERRFRQTLLCGEQARPQPGGGPERLLDFHLSLAATADEPADAGAGRADAPGVEQQALFDLLELLRQARPASMPAAALLRELLARHAPMLAEAGLLRIMQGALMGGLLRLHARPLALSNAASSRPCASAVARAQLAVDPQTARVTTLTHQLVALDQPLVRRLLPLLDGTREPPALCRALDDLDADALDAHLRTLAGLGLLSA